MNSTIASVGIRLDDDEAWAFVADAHTGVLTTLRRDGVPVSLPVWFVARDRHVYVQTPERAKKLDRIRHDSRAAFVVEDGERWTELKAVSMTGHARVVEGAEAEAARDALTEKYASYGLPGSRVPARTKAHYARSAVVRFDPDERFLTWDNARLRLREAT